LLATKASQPASPNSYSVLGSTLETIHSKVVATLDVLGGRIGADKKVVKFVTQESKIHTTTLTLSLGWQAFFIILRLNPQSTCKANCGPLGWDSL
jgi:hypothetical protein